jgi:hypothetical protein
VKGGASWLAALAALPLFAAAQPEPAQAFGELDYGLALDGAYYSGTRLLDDETSVYALVLQPRMKWTAPGGGSLNARARLQQLSTPDADARHLRTRATVQEAYWSDSHGAWSFSAGRQRVAWGRADGINPTDNLSPRDFTRLSFEDSDLREGRDLVQAAWSNDTHRVSMWVAAETEGHQVPMALPPGVPLKPLRHDYQPTLALRWDMSLAGLDASVSWLDGADLWPDLSPEAGGGIAQTQHRQRVIGADMALTRGAFVWRAEAAALHTDADPDDPWRKHDQISMVGGPEWSSGPWTVGAQALWRRVPNWRSPDRLSAQPVLQALAWQQAVLSQQDRPTQSGLTWRLAWRDDGLGRWVEATGLWIAQTRSGLVRLRAQTSGVGALQGWTFSAGVERLFGDEHSFFGALARNRFWTVQARKSF